MHLEQSPLRELPSYMSMLKYSKVKMKNMMPRWWMACDFEPMGRTEDGLGWELRGDPDAYEAFCVGYLNNVDMPIVESSDSDFDRLGMAFRAIFDFGMSAPDPHYRQCNNNA